MEKPRKPLRTLSELPVEETEIRLIHVLPGLKITGKQLAKFLGNKSIQHLVKYSEVTEPQVAGVIISPKKASQPRKHVHLHSQSSIRAMSPQVHMPLLRTHKRNKPHLSPSPLRLRPIQSTARYRDLMTHHLHLPSQCIMQPLSRPGRSQSPIPACERTLFLRTKKSTLS